MYLENAISSTLFLSEKKLTHNDKTVIGGTPAMATMEVWLYPVLKPMYCNYKVDHVWIGQWYNTGSDTHLKSPQSS